MVAYLLQWPNLPLLQKKLYWSIYNVYDQTRYVLLYFPVYEWLYEY